MVLWACLYMFVQEGYARMVLVLYMQIPCCTNDGFLFVPCDGACTKYAKLLVPVRLRVIRTYTELLQDAPW